MCDQQRLRPACAYAQSDQSLCSSLEYPMSVKLLTQNDLEFLRLKGGCTGSSESTLVKMPHCWKSHVTAQYIHPHYIQPQFHQSTLPSIHHIQSINLSFHLHTHHPFHPSIYLTLQERATTYTK